MCFFLWKHCNAHNNPNTHFFVLLIKGAYFIYLYMSIWFRFDLNKKGKISYMSLKNLTSVVFQIYVNPEVLLVEEIWFWISFSKCRNFRMLIWIKLLNVLSPFVLQIIRFLVVLMGVCIYVWKKIKCIGLKIAQISRDRMM